MINPLWLRSFAMLAETGSFTRAAERLDITQAAVSQHIRQLENQFGPLLVRRPRHLQLTPAGKAVLNYWQTLQQAEQYLTTQLTAESEVQGDIGLITPGSIGLTLYPLLLQLQQQYPELRVRCRFAPDHEVQQEVLANRYELGLVTLKPDHLQLTASLFAEEPLELVVPADAEVKSWDDLQQLGFIDHPDGQAMASRLLARWFPGSPGVKSLPQKGFINQIGMILDPVAAGLGFTVLPQHARQAYARGDKIRTLILGPELVDSLWLIHRAEWPLSARAAHAVTYLRHQLETGTQERFIPR